MELLPAYVEALVDALTRGLTVENLKTMLFLAGRRTAMPIGDDVHVLFAEVVARAMRDEWLPELLDAADKRPNNRIKQVVAELREVVAALRPEAIFQPDDLKVLIALVRAAGLDDADLVRVYEQAVPRPAPEVEWVEVIDLHALLVYRLSVMNGPPDQKPLLLFCGLLARATRTARARRDLDSWAKDRARKLKLTTVIREPTIADGLHAHLIVVVRPKDPAGNEPGHLLSAWSILESDGDLRWTHARSRPLARLVPVEEENLDQQVLSFIPRIAADLMAAGNRMTINLFVPVGLFRCAADRWDFKARRMQSVPLGSRYLVILRPWERNYDPEWIEERLEWRQLWDERHTGNRAFRLCKREIFRYYRAHRISGAALAFVPDSNDFQDDGLLMILVSSGTPIAVWPRSNSPKFESRLKSFLRKLTAAQFLDWRDEVFSLRKKAARVEESLGSHLTLLWDNPDHRPIDSPNMSEYREPLHADE